jgi:voltage-gated potassium channel
MLFLVGLIGLTVLVLFLERHRLVDHSTGAPPDLPGLLYFAMVTITTVGYGDIVPRDTFARMIDTFFLVPVRFIVLFTFLGTAYQIVIQRLQEDYRMKRTVGKLDGHILVCGYGATGRAAARELLLLGTPKDQVVVLDLEEDALRRANADGVVAVQGDASEEGTLRDVGVDRAAHLLIAVGRDDAAVLIALTARDLNANLRISAACRQQENVKLLQRSGADTIISPATAGGNLLAAATRRRHLVDTMQEVLSVGGKLRLDERAARPEELGKRPNELPGVAVIRVYRAGRGYDPDAFPALEQGDMLVLVRPAAEAAPA